MKKSEQNRVRSAPRSRRAFLGSLIAGIGASRVLPTLYASGSSLEIQSPAPPTNVRLIDGSAPSGSVLTQSDFTYLGSFKVPSGEGLSQPFVSSGGLLAYRYVSGQLRFMMTGPQQNINGWWQWPMLTEIAYPGESMTDPPFASVTGSWSDIVGGKQNGLMVTASDGGQGFMHGIYFDPATNLLWWAYNTLYEGNSHNPSIGCAFLNADGSTVPHGPWRTTIHSGMANGFILPIPAAFQKYTGGKTLIIGNPPHSQASTAPFGADMQMWAPINPNTPADPLNSTQASIATQSLLSFDINHPQARGTNYLLCSFNCQTSSPPAGCSGPYDASKGGSTSKPAPIFGGYSGSSTLLDWIDTCAWIDTGTKQGIIQFGQLVDTVAGHVYEDGGTMCHNWYGPGTCPHGQVAHDGYSATGPAAGSIASQVWIWNPSDLVAVAQGQSTPYSPSPASTFRIGALDPSLGLETGQYYRWGQSVYDPTTGKLFLTEKGRDVYGCCTWVPRIHVFRVAQS